MPMISASCEISREYAGKPPVAKPTTRPEATIVGKLRHGRNTQGRDGPALKRLTPGASDRGQDRAQHRKADRKLLRERHVLVHPESADEDRDDLERHEGNPEDDDRGGDRDHGIRGGEAAHDGRSAGFHRTEPEPRTEATAHAARDAKENATRGESGPSGPEEEPGRV